MEKITFVSKQINACDKIKITSKYRSTNVSSLAEIAQIVEESTQGVQNRVFVSGDEHPSQPFHYYDWTNFLSNYFKHIPLTTSYHHFHFSQGQKKRKLTF